MPVSHSSGSIVNPQAFAQLFSRIKQSTADLHLARS
jgi:hypothetical protein